MKGNEYTVFAFRFRLGIGIYIAAITHEYFPDEQEDGTMVLGSFNGLRLSLPFVEIIFGNLLSK